MSRDKRAYRAGQRAGQIIGWLIVSLIAAGLISAIVLVGMALAAGIRSFS